MTAKKILKELSTLFRFGLNGILATAIHTILALVFYSLLNYTPVISNVIAFSITFLISFFGQYFWVFNSEKSKWIAAIKLLAVNLFALLVSNWVLKALLESEFFQHDEVALVASVLTIPLITYPAGRFFVFK